MHGGGYNAGAHPDQLTPKVKPVHGRYGLFHTLGLFVFNETIMFVHSSVRVAN